MSEKITINPQLEESWKNALSDEFGAEYMKELKKKVVEEMETGHCFISAGQTDFQRFQSHPF